MRRLFSIYWPLFLLAAFIFSGCSSMPLAPKEDDQIAKRFLCSSNSASIYFFYEQKFFGAGATVSLFLDKKLVGGISNYTFYKLDVAPGKHKLDMSADASFATLNLETESSHIYFVRLTPWPNIQVVDDFEGRKQIQKCKLIEP
jgi:hypothetical protein